MIDGVPCWFSTGMVARKSQTAVLAGMGGTVVLATANVGPVIPDTDFFPLTVEYLESMYASGKISGSRFRKRDGFPTDDAILNRRIIDRTFRPRFPKDYRNEVQIIVKILSYNEEHDPVIIAGNAVSLALLLSKAPFDGPMGVVRVGLGEEEKPSILNKAIDRDHSMSGEIKMNMVLGGDGKTITNIDATVAEYPEALMVESMEFGLEIMKPWLDAQKEFMDKYGKEVEKEEYESFAIPEALMEKIEKEYGSKLDQLIATYADPDQKGTLTKMTEEVVKGLEGGEHSKRLIAEAFLEVKKKKVRKQVMEKDLRIGGRKPDEIRERDYRIDMLPEVHGSAMFTRGKTQVLAIITLSSARNQLLVDDMTGNVERRFFLHYVDAPFVYSETIGKVKYMPGGRQIGHSALAEKAFYPVLPAMEEFPYTIMCTCEVLEEHGSSSMASSTAPTMALMAAGVPLKKHVAGIAIGVMFNEDHSKYKVITDMGESEDFDGFMDFKVAGTEDGITSIQMDTKTPGLSMEIFKEAFEKAKTARVAIIGEMKQVIDKPRPNVSENAPKVDVVRIPVAKIGELIGPGGKNIKAITEETGAELDIEDDGLVHIFAMEHSQIEAAREIVKSYAFEPQVGEVYEGVVDGLAEFGLFVELARNVSGLVHVSEIKDGFVRDVKEEAKVGDMVKVKVLEISQDGKIKLTMKGLNNPTKSEDSKETSSKSDKKTTEKPEDKK